MDRESLAAQFNGEPYPFEPSKDVARRAKDAGLVIVWGNSDDLLEFRGAIHEELGAWRGLRVMLDAQGIIPSRDELLFASNDGLIRHANREKTSVEIHAVWCASRGVPPWTLKTSIPHATFDIMEDGECQSRGIVFRLADVSHAIR